MRTALPTAMKSSACRVFVIYWDPAVDALAFAHRVELISLMQYQLVSCRKGVARDVDAMYCMYSNKFGDFLNTNIKHEFTAQRYFLSLRCKFTFTNDEVKLTTHAVRLLHVVERFKINWNWKKRKFYNYQLQLFKTQNCYVAQKTAKWNLLPNLDL